MFGIFAGFAIVIACLGLFALTAFTAEQRTKEIGIRKVLGSSIGSIVFLLSKEITKLVGIAFLIASPIAWWAMNKWLEDYQFKIELGWQVFLSAGGLCNSNCITDDQLSIYKSSICESGRFAEKRVAKRVKN